MKNNTSKTIVVFFVVIAVMLAALAAIFAFYLVKEVELRKSADFKVEQMQIMEEKLKSEKEKLDKQITKLDDELQENTKQIEELIAEVDLQKSLKEEFKTEKAKLKEEKKVLEESLKQAEDENDGLRERLSEDLAGAEEKVSDLEKALEEFKEKYSELQKERDEIDGHYNSLKDKIEELSILPDPTAETGSGDGVTLEKIVVTPNSSGGAVISIDRDADFVIVSLGENQGIEKGSILSISRDTQEIGKVQVTRVLPKMSAADFIPPLTSDDVQKDDQVKIAQ